MTPEEHVDVLEQRHRYLEERVKAKWAVGWDYAYDQRERDSLGWAIDMLRAAMTPPETNTGECPHPEEKRKDYSTFEKRQFWCERCQTMVEGIA